VIFLLGLFWKRATERGALTAALGSFVLSVALKLWWPRLPFMDRVGLVFVLALVLAVVVSLVTPPQTDRNFIETRELSYETSTTFNAASVGVGAILVALYAIWW
jgi:SSS family solute:Na+ symporter